MPHKTLKCDIPGCYLKFRMSFEGYQSVVAEAENNGERFIGVLCPKHAQQAFDQEIKTPHNVEVPLGEILVESTSGKFNWRIIVER